MESCIESKTSGRRPPLVSVCMFSECTVQLLLGVANEACGSRPHGLVLALHGATQVKPPCVEVVCNSVQLDDTVVDCRCASTHGLASNGISLRMLPHGPVQEYWLAGLVRCQVADERLSTWFYAIGLALKLG